MCERLPTTQEYVNTQTPEKDVSDAFYRELGVYINPQALRIFIRKEWEMLSKAAHAIHEGR